MLGNSFQDFFQIPEMFQRLQLCRIFSRGIFTKKQSKHPEREQSRTIITQHGYYVTFLKVFIIRSSIKKSQESKLHAKHFN